MLETLGRMEKPDLRGSRASLLGLWHATRTTPAALLVRVVRVASGAHLPRDSVVQVRSAARRSARATDMRTSSVKFGSEFGWLRDSSTHSAEQTEQHGKDNRHAEEQPVDAATCLEDGTSAAKDATQPGAARLEQNRDHQGKTQNDLDHLKILFVWCEKTHALPSLLAAKRPVLASVVATISAAM